MKTTFQTYPVPGRTARYDSNAEKHAEYPCLRCGKAVKNGGVWVTLLDGGFSMAHADDAKAALAEDPSGYMGSYPVGPECAKHIPAALRR